MLVVITGKTCSGKDSTVKELVNLGYEKIITYTTRPKRKFEVNSKDYYFISEEDFKNKIKNNFFFEWTKYEVAGGRTWYYGSPRFEILKKDTTKNHIIILNPNGVDKLYQEAKTEKITYKIIYIKANNQTIEQRAKHRKDDKKEFRRRLEADEIDFCAMDWLADKIVWNNSDTEISDVADQIDKYINSFRNE